MRVYHKHQSSNIEKRKPRSVAVRITVAQQGQQFAAYVSLFYQGQCVNKALYFLSGYSSAERAWIAAYQRAQAMADEIRPGARVYIARPEKQYLKGRAKA